MKFIRKMYEPFGIGGIAICIASFAILALISRSPAGSMLENYVARKLEFNARVYFGKEPKLDPRIKIYVFDDFTLNYLRTDDLELEEWGKVLSAIAERKPNTIFVDKIFGTPRGIAKAEDFVNRLKNHKAKIVAGSYVGKPGLTGRNIANYEIDSYSIGNMINSAGSPDFGEASNIPISPGALFGPDRDISSAFTNIGHIMVEPFGSVRPLRRVEENWAIPHWSLFAARDLKIKSSQIYANGNLVPVDAQGLVVPNLISSREVNKTAKKFLSVVTRSLRGMPLDKIKTGDVVIILPAMYSGHTDWVDTPLDRVPGGYLMVSMVNSVLTGKWLRSSGNELGFLFVSCLIGLFAGTFLRSIKFSLAMLFTSALMVASGVFLFTYNSVIISWIFPVFGLLVTGGLSFADRARRTEIRMQNLRQHLKGHMSEDRIERILKNPNLLKGEPSGKVVSIMFIDIVGFSQIAETQTPGNAFLHLRELLSLLREIVHSCGGIVDKTLGDGMLCYFGYGPDGQETSREHADQALNCAVKIQRIVMAKNITASQKNFPIYPLRIGINTSAVFLGNIGNEHNFDFTLIGHGVNLAKRLESACQFYCVMLGSTTYDTLIDRDAPKARLIKRMIPVKHMTKPIEAYECDPFFDQPELVEGINLEYNKSIGVERGEERWPVIAELDIHVVTSSGASARIHDFSVNGFAIQMNSYIGNRTLLNFTFNVPDRYRNRNSNPTIFIVGEVRWGRPAGKEYIHGLLITNLNTEQKESLVSIWREMIHDHQSQLKKAS